MRHLDITLDGQNCGYSIIGYPQFCPFSFFLCSAASHPDSLLRRELVQQVDFLYLFSQIGHEKIEIILRDIQIAVPKNLRQRNNISSIQHPLSRKRMPVSMYSCLLNSTTFIIKIQHLVPCRLAKLFPIGIAEQILFATLMLPVFQILSQNAAHG